MAEAIGDAFRMDSLVVAAASYDGGVFPVMHDFLHHLQIKSIRSVRWVSSRMVRGLPARHV